MPLTSGSRLGPHEVLAAIGAGGMGEVYKARDTKRTQVFDAQNDPWELHPLPERSDRVLQLDSEMKRSEDPLV